MILKQWGKKQGSQKGGDVCFDEFLFFVMEFLVIFAEMLLQLMERLQSWSRKQ